MEEDTEENGEDEMAINSLQFSAKCKVPSPHAGLPLAQEEGCLNDHYCSGIH